MDIRGGVDDPFNISLEENKKENIASPSVSLTLGEEDQESNKSDFESHMAELKNQQRENDAGNDGVKDVKAPWVNLFKDNRKVKENIKLKAFEN